MLRTSCTFGAELIPLACTVSPSDASMHPTNRYLHIITAGQPKWQTGCSHMPHNGRMRQQGAKTGKNRQWGTDLNLSTLCLIPDQRQVVYGAGIGDLVPATRGQQASKQGDGIARVHPCTVAVYASLIPNHERSPEPRVMQPQRVVNAAVQPVVQQYNLHLRTRNPSGGGVPGAVMPASDCMQARDRV